MAANGIAEPRALDVGPKLLIPGAPRRERFPQESRAPPVPSPPRKHVVQPGETLYRIAKAYTGGVPRGPVTQAA